MQFLWYFAASDSIAFQANNHMSTAAKIPRIRMGETWLKIFHAKYNFLSKGLKASYYQLCLHGLSLNYGID